MVSGIWRLWKAYGTSSGMIRRTPTSGLFAALVPERYVHFGSGSALNACGKMGRPGSLTPDYAHSEAEVGTVKAVTKGSSHEHLQRIG